MDIDVWGNNDYFGSIYTGSEYEKNYVIFDTMSDWTVIMDNKADGLEIMSEYNLAESTSAKPILHENGSPEIVNIDFGKYDISGQKYTDKFCLFQN